MTSPPVSPLVNTDCLMEGDILQLEKYDILFNFSGVHRWLHPLKEASSIHPK